MDKNNVNAAVEMFVKRVHKALEGSDAAQDIVKAVWGMLGELGVDYSPPHKYSVDEPAK
ncbi:MAG: hypothetical protein H0Z35_11915 [Thermoanaerobacteraceae bacterium]|nr:hypothetical protein [Thermoanaerobacteraceae bacterium]